MGQSAAQNHRDLPNVTYASDQGTLGTATGFIVGTAAVTATTFVHSLILSERSNNADNATIRLVESGDTEGAGNDLFQNVALAARETVIIEFPAPGLVLQNGDALKGLAATASRVNYAVTYSTER